MLLLDELKALVEDGYEIADLHNLVGLKKKVYRSHESGFKIEDNNFGHMVTQRAFESHYEKWFSEVLHKFKQYGIQAAKFRIEADSFDPETESNLPAQRFIRRIKTLEKVIHDEGYRKQFISSRHLPPVRYFKGTLTQGENDHKPEEKDIIALLNLCWKNRAILSSRDPKIYSRQPKTITRSMLQAKLSIPHDRMVVISSAIDSIRKNKKIQIWLRYPKDEGVYIEVCQHNE